LATRPPAARATHGWLCGVLGVTAAPQFPAGSVAHAVTAKRSVTVSSPVSGTPVSSTVIESADARTLRTKAASVSSPPARGRMANTVIPSVSTRVRSVACAVMCSVSSASTRPGTSALKVTCGAATSGCEGRMVTATGVLVASFPPAVVATATTVSVPCTAVPPTVAGTSTTKVSFTACSAGESVTVVSKVKAPVPRTRTERISCAESTASTFTGMVVPPKNSAPPAGPRICTRGPPRFTSVVSAFWFPAVSKATTTTRTLLARDESATGSRKRLMTVSFTAVEVPPSRTVLAT